jgi:serine/threonine protein kinase
MSADGDFQPGPFGKFYLLDRIGAGGMAEVFRATFYSHGGFEKNVVIKRIRPEYSDHRNFVDMFVDEAKLSAQLSHPNIVQIIDFGRIRDHFFLAMEAVDGKDMRTLMKKIGNRGQVMPPDFAAFVAHEVAAALQYAHHKTDPLGNGLGIVHRDISPSNLLVSYDGEVKLADFGIAKANTAMHVERKGTISGKCEYMSPQQARGEPVDARSDMFSLGIVLWEMLTCRRLFHGTSPAETIHRVRTASIPPPSSIVPRVPPGLDAICVRLLARSVEARFADAQDLQDDLADFMRPQTPGRIKRSFARFVQELMAEERLEERQRLHHYGGAASAHAREAQQQTEEMSEEITQPGIVLKKRRPWPWIISSLVLMGALLWLVTLLWQGRGGTAEAPILRTGSIELVSDVAFDTVLLDGVPTENPLRGLDPLQTYTIEVRTDGYRVWSRKVTPRPGEVTRVPVLLRKR